MAVHDIMVQAAWLCSGTKPTSADARCRGHSGAAVTHLHSVRLLQQTLGRCKTRETVLASPAGPGPAQRRSLSPAPQSHAARPAARPRAQLLGQTHGLAASRFRAHCTERTRGQSCRWPCPCRLEASGLSPAPSVRGLRLLSAHVVPALCPSPAPQAQTRWENVLW